jgi:predicted DNA-binding antitoxin AbrB/MazE fold protein
MTATVEAVYENGVLRLPGPLPLKDNTRVVIVIHSKADAIAIEEREAWLRLSQENLTKGWDNPADDVFNELLDR